MLLARLLGTKSRRSLPCTSMGGVPGMAGRPGTSWPPQAPGEGLPGREPGAGEGSVPGEREGSADRKGMLQGGGRAGGDLLSPR